MNAFKEARQLATGIGGARLVALESDNHIVLEDEPAWQVFCAELAAFLEETAPQHRPQPSTSPQGDSRAVGLEALSPRELEILQLAAQGLDNDEIASSLHLSVRTVERHLSNTYAKLDLHGKSARTAAVARLLTRARSADRLLDREAGENR